MENWEKSTLSSDRTLREAIQAIDASGIQLILVANENKILEGILTDGDIRRSILKNSNLDIKIQEVMNRNPMTVLSETSREEILSIMRNYVLHHIPVVDQNRRIVDLVTLDDLVGAVERPNWVVLMAGGLGKRLRPLTDQTPKPLLSVGGKPILESILESFSEQGFRKFFISVNYKAEMIRNYFGNGDRWKVKINYIDESKSLGTAGALAFIPFVPEHPLIVMNGDLLTRANFYSLLKFHEQEKSAATMSVREYDFQVPYGVVNVEGNCILNIEEKPVHKFYVNAGIYVLSPESLGNIPRNTFYDMPTLFENLISLDKKTCAYLLKEYWLDIGRLEEFERAQKEWGKHSI
ncbi:MULTISPECIES: nucleotidyltransferase family protein [Leptospira]|uniref:CBS domain-containing protein n=1 Tax=Leptospira interrogans serovar Bataviae TaxID=312175 RepID=A0AAP9WJR2_LEPIR|nr:MULTISPECIES: nucleotidyltransferase family protein [Leptospira]EMN72555.1 CBS domain protein [Leptospira interrogans serovar Bataviae str. UI 08561]EKP04915.1 CBS domain protein [Leptospira kirschneri str. 2008720114]EKR25166.1 CBS domain protein [Leptospira interrogans serovar Bataviae str. L1111]MCR8648946.1 alcohol dehydrogenase [Leptospira interrogans serovar Bataviae]OAM73293.1 alcohol dehydrogenase [Leptospira interrogans serovar Bataviae]